MFHVNARFLIQRQTAVMQTRFFIQSCNINKPPMYVGLKSSYTVKLKGDSLLQESAGKCQDASEERYNSDSAVEGLERPNRVVLGWDDLSLGVEPPSFGDGAS